MTSAVTIGSSGGYFRVPLTFLNISEYFRVSITPPNVSEIPMCVNWRWTAGRAAWVSRVHPPTILALLFLLRLSMSPGIALRPHDARQQAQDIPHNTNDISRTDQGALVSSWLSSGAYLQHLCIFLSAFRFLPVIFFLSLYA